MHIVGTARAAPRRLLAGSRSGCGVQAAGTRGLPRTAPVLGTIRPQPRPPSLSAVRAVGSATQPRQSQPGPSSPAPDRSAAPNKARRVNPYRLPPLTTFLASFAPLHAGGWRLDVLPASQASGRALTGGGSGGGTSSHDAATDLLSGADLQGRRLTRAFVFPPNREGWRALNTLLAQIGEAVETEDHHPTLTVAPSSDLSPAMCELATPAGGAGDDAGGRGGYILHVSTHTHTPMPPLGAEGAAFDGTPRPGVTYKDLRLAERIEALVEEG